ncbi:hypothetical protein [Streptomyces wuyuanensis]|uniref:hypothetical protein n=1 Tax=Streptomyces wuyuanensis TaxID=1196353 RepID=UPI00344A1D7C
MSDAISFSGLYQGALKFAHSAMEANAESDMEVFLLHAGVSIERLAKSVLVDQNPVLLLEMKGKEEALFHLAGVKATTKLRTIGAATALARLRTMNILLPQDKDLDQLVELRNGIAHLTGEAEEAFDGLATFARSTNTLLAHLQIAPAEYWKKWHGAVEIALSEHMERVEREVAGRIESARFRLDKRLAGLPQTAIDLVYANARHNEDGAPYGLRVMCGDVTIRLPYNCPACRCEGTLSLGFPQRRKVPLSAPSRGFDCPLCWFTVWGDEEMRAIGVEPEVPIVSPEGDPLVDFDIAEYRAYGDGELLSRLESLGLWILFSHGPDPADDLRGNNL